MITVRLLTAPFLSLSLSLFLYITTKCLNLSLFLLRWCFHSEIQMLLPWHCLVPPMPSYVTFLLKCVWVVLYLLGNHVNPLSLVYLIFIFFVFYISWLFLLMNLYSSTFFKKYWNVAHVAVRKVNWFVKSNTGIVVEAKCFCY